MKRPRNYLIKGFTKRIIRESKKTRRRNNADVWPQDGGDTNPKKTCQRISRGHEKVSLRNEADPQGKEEIQSHIGEAS